MANYKNGKLIVETPYREPYEVDPNEVLGVGYRLSPAPGHTYTSKPSQNEDSQTASRYISNEVRSQVFIRDGGACVECSSKVDLAFDHVLPFSKGGSSRAENLQILCGVCNRKKYDKI